MERYRAVSLFSGCGGFCEGVRLAGFDVVAAVEQDPFACETYRHNFPAVPLFEGDVHDFINQKSPRWKANLDRFSALQDQPVDLVFGGPPCQGYSQIGTRSLNDPRNILYRQFIRILKAVQPRVFLIENVPNMLLLAKGKFKRDVLTALKKAGYKNSSVMIVAANDFGVPQARRRAIFFGVHDDVSLDADAEALFTAALGNEKQPPSVVRDVLWDLPKTTSSDDTPLPYPATRLHNGILDELRLDRDGRWYTSAFKTAQLKGDVTLHNHHTKEIQDRRRRLIKELKPGANAKSLPSHVEWNGARSQKWRRLHPDRPAYTILAQMHRDLSEWVHPKHDRWITVREAARLQSFHDGFVFKTSEWQMLKQVGNAVPPLMARALASAAADVLSHTCGQADVIPLPQPAQHRLHFDEEPGIALG